MSENNKKVKVSFLKLLVSTLAAAFGVQNRKNLEEDFNQTNPLPFILAGLIFTALFILSLTVVVKLVLKYAV